MAELKVIADTSFLMIPGLFGVDVISELNRLVERRYVLVVPSPVVGELKKLSKLGTSAERSAARLALALVKRGKVIEARGSADEAVLAAASGGDCVAATTDAALRKGLRGLGVPVVFLRQKSHLALDGRIW